VEISTIPESPPIVVHTFNTTLSSYARNTSNEAVLSMASIPVTSFSASKIHDHIKAKHKHDESPNEEEYANVFRHNAFEVNKVLTNYNSKLMNSIWGQYNLYASHAFQKNSEGSYAFLDFINVPQVKNLWDSLRATH